MRALLTRWFRSLVIGAMCLGLAMLLVTSCDNTGKACTSDAICAKGEICLQEKCTPGCRTNFDCVEGQFCLDNKCGKEACKPGTAQECYDGPEGTNNVGICRPGRQSCDTTGQWGICSGQLLPQTEVCDREDNNCDGKIDEGLNCECKTPGTQRACYSGPPATEKTTPCQAGVQACLRDNLWGKCRDQRLPLPEVCDGIDNDCDGNIDNDLACGCKDGDQRACYSGPPNTAKSGECKSGTQSCQSGKWSSCQGEVIPTKEICDNKDNDCNGLVDDLQGGQTCDGEPNTEGSPEPHAEVIPDASLPEEIAAPDLPLVPDVLPTDLPIGPDTAPAKYKYTIENIFPAQAKGELVPRDVAVDNNGKIYVVGTFKGNVTIGNIPLSNRGGDDVFVAGFDATGSPLWATIVGGPGTDIGYGIAVSLNGDNIYITGQCDGSSNAIVYFGAKFQKPMKGKQTFVARLSLNNGVIAFTEAIVPTMSTANESKGIDMVLSGGNVYVLGDFLSYVDFGHFPSVSATSGVTMTSIFLVEFTNNLVPKRIWEGHSDVGAVNAGSLAVEAGTFYITGQNSSAGNHTFARQPMAKPMEQASSTPTSAFVIRFNPTMISATKSMVMPCQTSCFGRSLALDSTSVMLAGDFTGMINSTPPAIPKTSTASQDIFVARLDKTTLQLLKLEATAASQNKRVEDVLVAPRAGGGAFVSYSFGGSFNWGGYTLQSVGVSDALFSALDSTWSVDWAAQTASLSGSLARVRGMATNASGDLWIVGSFGGSTLFSSNLATSKGDEDMFLLKLTKSP